MEFLLILYIIYEWFPDTWETLVDWFEEIFG